MKNPFHLSKPLFPERRVIRYQTIHTPNLKKSLCFAIVSDLHNGPYEDLLPIFDTVDAVLFPGDLVDRHHPGLENAAGFLAEAPKHAPVFFSSGNHEWKSKEASAFRELLEQSSVECIDSRIVHFNGIAIGGLGSAPSEKIDATFPEKLAAEPGFRLLLCHHPEWYARYIRQHGIDLTISGHAHGGQVQFRNRGILSPGQGLFPKLTNGFYDNDRLLVSRGATNSVYWFPRVNNPCEIILLNLEAD